MGRRGSIAVAHALGCGTDQDPLVAQKIVGHLAAEDINKRDAGIGGNAARIADQPRLQGFECAILIRMHIRRGLGKDGDFRSVAGEQQGQMGQDLPVGTHPQGQAAYRAVAVRR